MGELILCRQSIAANPYFIEDGALNVYSLEELSYYIAHNVYLLSRICIQGTLSVDRRGTGGTRSGKAVIGYPIQSGTVAYFYRTDSKLQWLSDQCGDP